jgi:hypothetical protein
MNRKPHIRHKNTVIIDDDPHSTIDYILLALGNILAINILAITYKYNIK